MVDNFGNAQGTHAGMGAPAISAVAVTPHDSNDIDVTRSLYVGGAGNIKVDMHETGTAVTFEGVLAGSILPLRVSRVYSADTTATLIVALY